MSLCTQCIHFGGFDCVWPLQPVGSSQSMVDVEANAPGASGRARINGLIGLLLRPCKAKGRRARRITLHRNLRIVCYLLFPCFFHLPFQFSQKAWCSCTYINQVMDSVDLIRQMSFNASHGLRKAVFHPCGDSTLYTPNGNLCYIHLLQKQSNIDSRVGKKQ